MELYSTRRRGLSQVHSPVARPGLALKIIDLVTSDSRESIRLKTNVCFSILLDYQLSDSICNNRVRKFCSHCKPRKLLSSSPSTGRVAQSKLGPTTKNTMVALSRQQLLDAITLGREEALHGAISVTVVVQ
jgi:hypothetical protein